METNKTKIFLQDGAPAYVDKEGMQVLIPSETEASDFSDSRDTIGKGQCEWDGKIYDTELLLTELAYCAESEIVIVTKDMCNTLINMALSKHKSVIAHLITNTSNQIVSDTLVVTLNSYNPDILFWNKKLDEQESYILIDREYLFCLDGTIAQMNKLPFHMRTVEDIDKAQKIMDKLVKNSEMREVNFPSIFDQGDAFESIYEEYFKEVFD